MVQITQGQDKILRALDEGGLTSREIKKKLKMFDAPRSQIVKLKRANLIKVCGQKTYNVWQDTTTTSAIKAPIYCQTKQPYQVVERSRGKVKVLLERTSYE